MDWKWAPIRLMTINHGYQKNMNKTERTILSLSFLFSFGILYSIISLASVKEIVPLLVVISLDGFRYEYLNRTNMIKKNDLVFRLKPQFPSYTFPNHYTLATGLYLESHGMIGNVFYDYQKNILFQANNASVNKIKDFWQAEPVSIIH